jgi:gliding motility-associated-like protein
VSSSINTLDTALICAGDSLFLGGTWQTTAGNYKDTLTSSGGCDSIVATNLSIIPPNGSSNNTNVCPGDSVFVQGAWQTIAGTYYDTLTSILGCDSVIETVLSVDTVYSISSSVSICQGDSVLLPGGSYTSIAGIFTDSFSTVTGCDSVFITNVTVDTVFDATITPVNAICANTGILMLTAADGGGTWSGTGITNADSGYFDPSLAGPGTHEIIYTIGGSCGDSDTINISVYEVPSLSILEVAESCDGVNDGSVDLTVTGGTMPYAYLWDDPVSSTTDTLMALPPGTYTVVVTDANLCTVTDNANVLSSSTPCIAPYLYIPNIFSPNGDEKNDKLFVQGKGIEEMTFIIYDRWGEKVFETNDLIDGWDGSYQGKPMNEAVFVYYVKASLINNEIIERKGNISIVR